jgi:hypothetical protein
MDELEMQGFTAIDLSAEEVNIIFEAMDMFIRMAQKVVDDPGMVTTPEGKISAEVKARVSKQVLDNAKSAKAKLQMLVTGTGNKTADA